MNLATLILALFSSVLVRSTTVPQDHQDDASGIPPNLPAPVTAPYTMLLDDIVKINKPSVRVASAFILFGIGVYLWVIASQQTELGHSLGPLLELTESATAAYSTLFGKSAVTWIVSLAIPFLTLPLVSSHWCWAVMFHWILFIIQSEILNMKNLTAENYQIKLAYGALFNRLFSFSAFAVYVFGALNSD